MVGVSAYSFSQLLPGSHDLAGIEPEMHEQLRPQSCRHLRPRRVYRKLRDHKGVLRGTDHDEGPLPPGSRLSVDSGDDPARRILVQSLKLYHELTKLRRLLRP